METDVARRDVKAFEAARAAGEAATMTEVAASQMQQRDSPRGMRTVAAGGPDSMTARAGWQEMAPAKLCACPGSGRAAQGGAAARGLRASLDEGR